MAGREKLGRNFGAFALRVVQITSKRRCTTLLIPYPCGRPFFFPLRHLF